MDSGRPRDIVLVVDDSADNLSMLTHALEDAGLTVLVARDGDSALSLVQQITPDIILMDAVMPGRDGFETTRLLKQQDALSHVPVVFMTGLTETEDIVKGLGAGGVDYVTKPVSPDELIARMRVHLANARASQSAREALDASGRFLLAVDQAGDLLWCTPHARRMLSMEEGGQILLPETVRAWLRQMAGSAPAAPQMVVDIGPRRFQVSFLARTGPDQFMLRITDEMGAAPEIALREKLGLTAREAEVLLWLARGKANKDIAEILTLSPRTVNKHLEGIYQKLGVENRASAATLAVKAMARD